MMKLSRAELASARFNLTSRQLDLLREMALYIEAKGYPPSLAELCTATGISSKSVCRHNLNRMHDLGFIFRPEYMPRTMRLTARGWAALGKPDPDEVATMRDDLIQTAIRWARGEVDGGTLAATVQEYEEVSA